MAVGQVVDRAAPEGVEGGEGDAPAAAAAELAGEGSYSGSCCTVGAQVCVRHKQLSIHTMMYRRRSVLCKVHIRTEQVTPHTAGVPFPCWTTTPFIHPLLLCIPLVSRSDRDIHTP